MFKVTKNPFSEEGYFTCNELRQYWSSAQAFDEYLEDKIILGPKQIESKETHVIWDHFQYKFMLCLSLYNYVEFFEYILGKVIRSFIDQHVIIIELRHIFGCVVDDDEKPIGVKAECEIFERVVKQVQ